MNVDSVDISALEIIRAGVSDLILRTAGDYDGKGVLLLDVAPQDWSGAKEHYQFSKIETMDLDPNSGADYIADLTHNNSQLIPSARFDVIVLTEVLEHTLNPFLAVAEVYRLLKDGGILVMTTPFNFRVHGPLPDCWRFTEYGIRELLKNFSHINIEENGSDRFLCPVQYQTIAIK